MKSSSLRKLVNALMGRVDFWIRYRALRWEDRALYLTRADGEEVVVKTCDMGLSVTIGAAKPKACLGYDMAISVVLP